MSCNWKIEGNEIHFFSQFLVRQITAEQRDEMVIFTYFEIIAIQKLLLEWPLSSTWRSRIIKTNKFSKWLWLRVKARTRRNCGTRLQGNAMRQRRLLVMGNIKVQYEWLYVLRGPGNYKTEQQQLQSGGPSTVVCPAYPSKLKSLNATKKKMR